MKLMQVFDCQDMPAVVRENFFKQTDEYGNDCYVVIDLEDFKQMPPDVYKEEYGYNGGDGGVIFKQWLLDNGATDNEVLVNHWW